MWSRSASLAAVFLAAWAAFLAGCHLEPEEEAYLEVLADSTWLAHDSVSVLLADSTGETLEVLRHGPLDSLEQLDRLKARKYSGGRMVLVLIGYRDDLAVLRETRTYDGVSQTTLDREVEDDVHTLNPGRTARMDLGPDTLRLYRGGPSSLLRPAPAGDWDGKPLDWSTSDAGVAVVSRGMVAPVGPGTARIRARSGHASDSVTVIVVDDVPDLWAGADTVVQAPASLAFRVKVTQEHGGIALFKWSLDGDTAWDDSLRGIPESQAVLITDVRKFTLPGQYALHFLVEDGEGNRVLASRQLTVQGATVPQAPIAYAGRDTVVKAGSHVTLIGSSSDPDGNIVSREWSTEGTSILLANSDAFVFPAGNIGVHSFVYRVTDADGLSASDTVQVTVKPISDGNPPVIFGIQVETVLLTDGDQRAFTALLRGNGNTLTYSWDYDGDGVYDEISMIGSKGNGEVDSLKGYFQYSAPGEYWAGLKLLDSEGRVAIGGVWVIVTGIGNNGLSSFIPDAGILSPEFFPTVHEYWVLVSPTLKNIRFTATPQSANAFVLINRVEVGNGELSQAFPLTFGENVFNVEVHNPTGEVISYAVIVQRTIFLYDEQPLSPAKGTF